MAAYPGNYRFHTIRGLPGFDQFDPGLLAKDRITPLRASDGMRFQVDIDRPDRQAAANCLTAALGEVFSPEDLRFAS